jgi:hypothetical protein
MTTIRETSFFASFWIGNIADSVHVEKRSYWFKHISNNLNRFLRVTNRIRILYNTSLLMESLTTLKSVSN